MESTFKSRYIRDTKCDLLGDLLQALAQQCCTNCCCSGRCIMLLYVRSSHKPCGSANKKLLRTFVTQAVFMPVFLRYVHRETGTSTKTGVCLGMSPGTHGSSPAGFPGNFPSRDFGQFHQGTPPGKTRWVIPREIPVGVPWWNWPKSLEGKSPGNPAGGLPCVPGDIPRETPV